MLTVQYDVPPLTPEQLALIAEIDQSWNEAYALTTLKSLLQTASEIELATIPIYLSTYYSINRTPDDDVMGAGNGFPNSAISRFANEAGALIMSVAVEEMLHMSLATNILYAVGAEPNLYLNAPNSYPAILPGHRINTPCGDNDNTRNKPIPMAKFSFQQLSAFLAIEYPADPDAPPEKDNWDTIGQVYSYIRCIIESKWITDAHFQNENVAEDQQIKATEYSANNIDTVYASAEFNNEQPLPTPVSGSAATVAEYTNDEDSHVGTTQLLQINSCETAVQAITTICFQGEGFDFTQFDDPNDQELSHYIKYATLQSELVGYNQAYINQGAAGLNNLSPDVPVPQPATTQYSDSDLASFVYPMRTNPVAADFTDGRADLVNIADGLFQYMLVMTETIYKIPLEQQKVYFNRTMHQSMIWIMDKLYQAMRTIQTADGYTLSATFANYNLGSRAQAFGTLCKMINNFQATYGKNGSNPAAWLTNDVDSYLSKILELPDVSCFWDGSTSPNPDYLQTPSKLQDTGTKTSGTITPVKYTTTPPYDELPKWPTSPPTDNELPEGAVRHACMGLNSCKDQGRTLNNNCAGQGYCATALAYNPNDPANGTVSDHTCHVLNDCRNQGGCGLYGTAEEFALAGHNDCQSQGSCATPINAERFITDGPLRGQSVWLQARKVFTEQVWPELKANNPTLPENPPPIKGSDSEPDLFQYGPTIGWIENDNDHAGMTACGSSGMSGAGSCA